MLRSAAAASLAAAVVGVVLVGAAPERPVAPVSLAAGGEELCSEARQGVAKACELFGESSSACGDAHRAYNLQDCSRLQLAHSLKHAYDTELAHEEGQDTDSQPRSSWFRGPWQLPVVSTATSAEDVLDELGEELPTAEELSSCDAPGLKPGSVIALRGGRGKYCVSHPKTKCDSDTVDKEEIFHVVDAGCPFIGLKGGESKCFDKKLNAMVPCHEGHVMQIEKFTVVMMGDGKIALKSKDGLYCSDSPSGVVCHQTAVGNAESFTVQCLEPKAGCLQGGPVTPTIDEGKYGGKNHCDLKQPHADRNASRVVEFVASDPTAKELPENIMKHMPKTCRQIAKSEEQYCFHKKYGNVTQSQCCTSCARIKYPNAIYKGYPYHKNKTVTGPVNSSGANATNVTIGCLIEQLEVPLNASLLGACEVAKGPKKEVNHGTECKFDREGYDCKASTCNQGFWLPTKPSCGPKGCNISDLNLENGTSSLDPGCSNSDALAIGGVTPSGVNCTFTKVGHTCPPSSCRYGKWSRQNVTCVPDSVAAEAGVTSALKDQLQALQHDAEGKSP